MADTSTIAQVELNIVTRPDGAIRGGCRMDEQSLHAAKLKTLRQVLAGAGVIKEEEVFLDQGVPVDRTREEAIDAIDIVLVLGDWISIEIMSKQAAEYFLRLEAWKEQLPIIDATGYQVTLDKPRRDEYNLGVAAGKEGENDIRTGPKPAAEARSELTVNELQALLNYCRLFPRQLEPATCAALRLGNEEIEFGTSNVITCKKIRILGSETSREDRVRVSQSEDMRRWQTELLDSNNLGIHIPLLFGIKASSARRDERQTFEQGDTVHISRVLSLPKAEVMLEGVDLADEFVQRVRGAVDANSAPGLLDVLTNSGLFVATHFVIGGKVVCRSSTVLNKKQSRSELTRSFRLETTGALVGQKILQSGQKEERVLTAQTHRLNIKTVGGAGEANSGTPGEEGSRDWLSSIATRPETWRIIGYKDAEIKPILDYLPDALKRRAKELLRQYFESKLQPKKSVVQGGSGGAAWDDGAPVNSRQRITECTVMRDQNIDSIRFGYKNQDTGRTVVGAWHGASREEVQQFQVQEGDEIVAVEVGWDVTIDHVILHTRNGDNKGRFIGRGNGAKRTHIFQEPRIRGFHGTAGHFLDALGVYYFNLPETIPKPHRFMLLSLERYLYGK